MIDKIKLQNLLTEFIKEKPDKETTQAFIEAIKIHSLIGSILEEILDKVLKEKREAQDNESYSRN